MQVEQGKYGATKDVYFELFEVDGVDLRTDWTPAAADCQVSVDGGAYSNSDNIAVVAPNGSGTYKVVLSITEMTGKVALIKLVDAATKVFLDKVIKVETYGNASAMHAFDLGTALASQTVGTVTTLTGHTAQTGDSFARIGATGSGLSSLASAANLATVAGYLDTEIAAIKAVTDLLPDAGALTTIGTDTARLTAVRAAVLTDLIDGGRLDLLIDAIKAVTDALPDAGALTTIAADAARLTAERAAILTDWIDGGRLDNLLDGAASAGDPWTTTLPGAYGAGTAGKIVGDNINAPIATVDTVVDAIKAVTDIIPNAGAMSDLATLAARLTEARAGYLDELGAANVPADIDTLITRITAAVALASVCTEGRLAELDAANLPTDIAAIPTTPMRGTDGANTVVPDAAGTAPTAAEIKTAIEAAGSHLALIKAATDLFNFTAGNVHAHTKATDVGGDASAANQAVIMGYLDTEIAAILAAVDTEVAAIKDAIEHATYGLSAIRTRGDAAWITGGGGALTEILNIQPLVPNSIDLADTATVRIGLGLTNMLDDLPGTAEITQGTIKIERKAFGGTSWSTVVDDAACSEVAGLVYYDEVFDGGTGYAQGDSIRITFKNQKITAAANDYEITGSDGWPFQTYIRDPLLSLTGVTSGGTWTMAEWLKMQIALAGGKFRDKSGASGTYEILDPDDGTTVIAEAIPSETSPYWQITKMI